MVATVQHTSVPRINHLNYIQSNESLGKLRALTSFIIEIYCFTKYESKRVASQNLTASEAGGTHHKGPVFAQQSCQ